MPLTPFHLGPGIFAKSILPGSFSLSAFALANAAMDVEPLCRLLISGAAQHGASHSIIGAIFIGIAVALFGWPLITRTWRVFDRTAGGKSFQTSQLQIWIGALLGVGSHLLLDALIHPDLHPFLPFTDENPLLHVAWTQHVYLLCVLSGMLGILVVLTRAVLQHEHA